MLNLKKNQFQTWGTPYFLWALAEPTGAQLFSGVIF
jgi:hypothetical protein